MKILIACEFSGIVREAFRAKGHNAWSCDFLPSDIYGQHYQGDVLDILDDRWDMMIAHPPCQYLCNSAVHLLKKEKGRWEKMLQGATFFKKLWEAPIDKIAAENPVMHGYGKKIIGFQKFTQFIQPYDFGEDASKKTGLLLKNLPPLMDTLYISPKIVKYNYQGSVKFRPRWRNQSPCGANNLGPSPDRWKLRSTTYQGIANAMAEQWGRINDEN